MISPKIRTVWFFVSLDFYTVWYNRCSKVFVRMNQQMSGWIKECKAIGVVLCNMQKHSSWSPSDRTSTWSHTRTPGMITDTGVYLYVSRIPFSPDNRIPILFSGSEWQSLDFQEDRPPPQEWVRIGRILSWQPHFSLLVIGPEVNMWSSLSQ